MAIPPLLAKRYRELIPDNGDYVSFIASCKTSWPYSMRGNSLKVTPSWTRERIESYGMTATPVKGLPGSFRLGNISLSIGSIWEVRRGFIQIQELASQLPANVLQPKPGDVVLDMAAAPGNKTVQMAELMKNEGMILACEPKKDRIKSLRFFLGKCGVINTTTTLQDAVSLPDTLSFDKILLDAPCSGEGLLRKNPSALSIWSEKFVIHKAKIQTKLILRAADLLKEGGEMVYSTCTLAPEENEGVITTLLHERPDMELVPVNTFGLSMRDGMKSFRNRTFCKGIEYSKRLYPHETDTQSFYMAKLRKRKHA